ncbi:beta family protein [Bradyrhizobium oligotrophicum]|uniref:beta family protein n=1 Tax=Bradyrhizobium oligotrophicum TaxID=44255 RepID=UPI003EB839AE
MLNIGSGVYSPVLRLKEGEYTALGQLPADVLARLLPLFVIPPAKERDPELQRQLTASELVSIPGQRLGKHWPLRPCMFDPRFLFKQLGADNAAEWLPELFRVAMAAHGRPIPVVDLRTVERGALDAIRSVVHRLTHNLALRVTLDDLTRTDLRTRIHSALLKISLKPQDCILILDFGKAELSDPQAVGEILLAQFQKVMELGLWGQVIWHATSYPEKNPASPGQLVELPRNEWLAWSHAINLDSGLRKHLMFGDFAADSAKFAFGSGGIAPICHYRYSTPRLWIVIRALEAVTVREGMKEIATRLVSSEHFAGRAFSRGDRYIADTASGRDGPGNATTWRKVNTVHHLNRVVTDLGPHLGYQIAERKDTPIPEQTDLFGRNS